MAVLPPDQRPPKPKRRPRPPRPIEDMSKDELRAHALEMDAWHEERAALGRVRGAEHRTKLRERRIIRFAVNIPEDLKEGVAEVVREYVAAHSPPPGPPAPAHDRVIGSATPETARLLLADDVVGDA